VISEMKRSFTLELVLQAVDRTSACDEIWLALGASKSKRRACEEALSIPGLWPSRCHPGGARRGVGGAIAMEAETGCQTAFPNC
jgi:hypothetical protein